LLDAQPCAGESDTEIVEAAWNFQRINQCYRRLMKILDERPDGMLRSEVEVKAMSRWASAERKAWLNAITNDPLLPKRLLPPGYLGQSAWQRRVEVLHEAGTQIQKYPGI